MLNLFAFRSTDPAGLSSAADPVGPLNDEAIGIAAVKRLLTVAAWGAHPFAIERARVVAPQFSALFCLGLTKDGHPRHPLYVKADAPLIPFVT